MSRQPQKLVQPREWDRENTNFASYTPHEASNSRAVREGASPEEHAEEQRPSLFGIFRPSHTTTRYSSHGSSQYQYNQGRASQNVERHRPRLREPRARPEPPNPIEALASERDYYKEKFSAAEKSSIEWNEKATELVQEISFLKEENERIRLSADKLQLSMSKRAVFFGEQLPDDVVRSRFGALVSGITAWSGRFACAGRVDPAALREEDLPFYRKVVLGATGLDSLHALFQEKKNRKFFVRGWTAYVLCDAIFRTLPSENHPGSKAQDCFVDMPSSKGIRTLEDNLQVIAPGRMNDWRAFTFALFAQANRNGYVSDWAANMIRNECRRVLSVIEPWDQSKGTNGAENGLIAIFEEAVRFSHMLRKQRASWTVRFLQVMRADASVPGGILPYDTTYMTSDSDDEMEDEDTVMERHKAVELVITPALVKRGNADGEQFEVESCMARAVVSLPNGLLIP